MRRSRRARSSSRTARATTSTAACCRASSRRARSTRSSRRCASSAPAALDPLVGAGGFDFIRDLGAQMPMRTIGMLLGIPEAGPGGRSASASTRGCASTTARCPSSRSTYRVEQGQPASSEYIDWRAEHPSDDLMTELLNAEFEDETGTRTRLTREEVLGYVNLLAAAGNETTTRLIGWTGKVLAEHPDQRRELVERPRPRAERDRGAAALRVALAGAGALRHQGRRAPRAGRSRGQRHGAAERRRPTATSGSSRTATASTSTARSTTTSPSATASTSASAPRWRRLEGRVALDEVLKRFPTWEVDWDNAVQARTSTVRGWERLPVFTS